MNIPCKIGDRVWAIRSFGGVWQVKSGRVSEMFYVGEEMKLCIVVWNLTRGQWGKKIFGTYEEAEKALEERKRRWT